MSNSNTEIPVLSPEVLARVGQLFEHELVLVLILDERDQVIECRIISLVDAMALLAANQENQS